jgi:diaminopimelate decarboxylase
MKNLKTENKKSDMKNEICNECGRSVAMGATLFVNRVADLNDIKQRKKMGKEFPKGDFICEICESHIHDFNIENE